MSTQIVESNVPVWYDRAVAMFATADQWFAAVS